MELTRRQEHLLYGARLGHQGSSAWSREDFCMETHKGPFSVPEEAQKEAEEGLTLH